MNEAGESGLRQNGVVQPLLTDLYQITMAYGYWKSSKTADRAVFDLFFRKNPFQGEFTIFAGLQECLKFLARFNYSESDIAYLKTILLESVEEEFYSFLRNLTAKEVTVYALSEGSICFPRIPLLRVEGPLIVVQLLETTFLTLVNYASLMATNAARYRMAAGNLQLLEFGLRSAQGTDGGLSASKYCYIGGFDGTSNLLAGKLYDIPVCGTHDHAYVTSFGDLSELRPTFLQPREGGEPCDLVILSIEWRSKLNPLFSVVGGEASDGELAAMVSYAAAFPKGFAVLVDTYDVKRYPSCHDVSCPVTLPGTLSRNEYRSGLLNFCAVALALNDLGYRAVGIRIDSGDLAYLSNVAYQYFCRIRDLYNVPWFADLMIMASNDINDETILSLNDQGHKINCFGIGTNLVTCQRQPALGCVYKLVELNGRPRIKLSQDVGKVTIPGRKEVYRLYSETGDALVDLMQKVDEEPPVPGEKVLCRHPFEESKRAYVTPSKVEGLLKVYWKDGKICQPLPTLMEIRESVKEDLKTIRIDIKRSLNPTPFKVAVSNSLYSFLHDLWLQNAPIGELY